MSDREVPDDAARIPSLLERLEGVFLRPRATFEALDPRWGWLEPWLAVVAAGLLAAIVNVACVDHRAIGARRTEYLLEQRAEQDRRMTPVATEDRDKMARFDAYAARVGAFAGPLVGTILRITLLGVLLFGVAAVSGGKRELLRAIVLAAHLKLIAVVAYGAAAVGALAGNPEPLTSPANLVNVVEHPVAFALLEGLDPIAIWHAVLVGLGLVHALGVPQRRATRVAVALYLVKWGGSVLLALASFKGKA